MDWFVRTLRFRDGTKQTTAPVAATTPTLAAVLTAGNDGGSVGMENAGEIQTDDNGLILGTSSLGKVGGGSLDFSAAPILAQLIAAGAVVKLEENVIDLSAIGNDSTVRIENTGTPSFTSKLGFFDTPPVARPVVPLTTPDAQDVIDALVALGLIVQHD